MLCCVVSSAVSDKNHNSVSSHIIILMNKTQPNNSYAIAIGYAETHDSFFFFFFVPYSAQGDRNQCD